MLYFYALNIQNSVCLFVLPPKSFESIIQTQPQPESKNLYPIWQFIYLFYFIFVLCFLWILFELFDVSVCVTIYLCLCLSFFLSLAVSVAI